MSSRYPTKAELELEAGAYQQEHRRVMENESKVKEQHSKRRALNQTKLEALLQKRQRDQGKALEQAKKESLLRKKQREQDKALRQQEKSHRVEHKKEVGEQPVVNPAPGGGIMATLANLFARRPDDDQQPGPEKKSHSVASNMSLDSFTLEDAKLGVPANLKPLSQGELLFVETMVTKDFLTQFGTSRGFSEFCKTANRQGFTCSGGAGAKSSYATYLKNAKAGGSTLLQKMATAYGSLDGFTKAGMRSTVYQGNSLKTRKIVPKCLLKDYKLEDLRAVAKAYGIAHAGKTKLELCSALSEQLTDTQLKQIFNVTAINEKEGVAVSVTPASRSQTDWKDYARRGFKGARKGAKTYTEMQADDSSYTDSDSPLLPEGEQRNYFSDLFK